MIGSFKEMDKKRQHFNAARPGMKLTHPFFDSPLLPVISSILSGILLALSFPGFGNATLIFVALVPLMFAVQSASGRKVAWLALLSGFVFFMMSLWWLTALRDKVDGLWMAICILLGFGVLALYCGLYFIPFAFAVSLGTKRWVGEKLWQNIRFMFAVTMVWVGSEYLRGFLFTGFPWNPLGVSQYANPAIIQVAEWGGVSMVSAYIVWMNAGIFVTFRQYTHGTRTRKYRPHYELMLGILPIALSVAHGMNTLFNRPDFYEPVRVALVQPNIPLHVSWDQEKDQEAIDILGELTSAATRLDDIDLVIWPETALPDFLEHSPACRALVAEALESGVPLLAGMMDYSRQDGKTTYYNSSVLFETNGAPAAVYYKQHLVPFGEYIPFPGLMSVFTPIEADFGAGEESTLFPLRGKPSFSALICFEDTIAPLAVKAVRGGARWLVNQTNDGWFDPSSESEQHLAHAVFRCIENRVPMARCSNTGVTGIIDAFGNIDRKLEPMTKGFTTGTLHPRPVGLQQTFYTRYGNLFAKVSLASGAIVLFVLGAKTRRKKRKKHEDMG